MRAVLPACLLGGLLALGCSRSGGASAVTGGPLPSAVRPDGAVGDPWSGAGGTGSAGEPGSGALDAGGLGPGVGGPGLDAGCVLAGAACDAGPPACASTLLPATVDVVSMPATVLFVHDRSESMQTAWDGQMRWEAVGAAVEAALAPLAVTLDAGAVFFPSSDPAAKPICVDPTGIACLFNPALVIAPGTCAVNSLTAADQIDLRDADSFLETFTATSSGAAPIFAPIPMGGTPLLQALQLAEGALAAASPQGPASVVVITDGEPNCGWVSATARQIVTDWRAAGIETYLVGLPTQAPIDVVDDLASAAGTEALLPLTADGLQDQLTVLLERLAQARVGSCVIGLDAPADGADPLHLVVEHDGADHDVPRDLGGGSGWALSTDRTEVTLEGELCAAAQDGRIKALRLRSGCVELPALGAP